MNILHEFVIAVSAHQFTEARKWLLDKESSVMQNDHWRRRESLSGMISKFTLNKSE